MNHSTFNKIVRARQSQTKETLIIKAKEYARNNDRLHNFKRAADIKQETQAQALWGMFAKHLVSIIDMVEATVDGVYPDEELINEKIGDAINYLHLLEAVFIEENNK